MRPARRCRKAGSVSKQFGQSKAFASPQVSGSFHPETQKVNSISPNVAIHASSVARHRHPVQVCLDYRSSCIGMQLSVGLDYSSH